MADNTDKKVPEKMVKCVVINGFGMARKGTSLVYRPGDVAEFTEDQAKRFGPYPGCLPRDINLKPISEVSKEELANLNKVGIPNKVDAAPNKGNPAGKNK